MYYIGIDLGGTNIAVGLVDENCNIVKKESIPTRATRTDKEIIKDMAELSAKVISDAGVDLKDVAWVGIGSPGSVDRENGILLYANNIPFVKTPMREIFRETLNLPVYIDNDANCAALGEAYAGSAKNCNHAVFVTLGTGVGGGLIIDKKIYAGFNDNGAEIGHMIINHNGRKCSCGRRGCWEAYASVSGLIVDTIEAMKWNQDSLMWKLCGGSLDNVNGRTSFDAAKQGDEAALEVVNNYFSYVAAGITDLVNIFQPEILCIGGSISKEGEYLLAPVRKIVEKERYTRYCKQTELKMATLGGDAGIIGAAMLGK